MTLNAPAALTYRTRQVSQQVSHWFWIPIGTPPADVFINEIMYHPDRTNEADYAYVELYNPASAPVTLMGWRLEGVSFDFPSGAVIAANGYLVCCANSNVIRTAYGITNAIGNWTGQLQHNGETLTLYNQYGRDTDSARYDDREPWPVAADGLGPALERICATATGNTSLNPRSCS